MYNCKMLMVIGFTHLILLSCGQEYSPPSQVNFVDQLPHLFKAPQDIEEIVNSMNDQDLVGQVLLVKAGDILAQGCTLVNQLRLGGVVYYGNDITTAARLKQDNQRLQSCAKQAGLKADILTSTNHEGGNVYYFDEQFPEGDSRPTKFESAAQQCRSGIERVRKVSTEQSLDLKAAGLNATLGPVADILLKSSVVIGERAYSSDPIQGTKCILAALDAYQNNGLHAVLKHFPGHGNTSADTHQEFATDSSTYSQLGKTQLIPYASAQFSHKLKMVMLSHVYFPQLDNQWPSSLSRPVINILKEPRDRRLEPFSGVIMTDDLGMKAISDRWDVAEASVFSIMQGSDMAMINSAATAQKTQSILMSALKKGYHIKRALDVNKKAVEVNLDADYVRQRLQDSAKRVLNVKLH